ncbi:amino acid adenylation domain-containing protein [Flavobacterium psychroterrae]|uniref:Amino acid adenylation domain-containing protein n=1 Tax=Flavobacterium psychroterrae TaxID=2133767 RepID=A0ABS5PHF4_9FLAO|nr:non-ribosomal peptide synthetase [Flavobacterium psychroterrae]MBS7233712.1 amino acid adenylation domain-containing protein [Flavobacterium psychroterrae]
MKLTLPQQDIYYDQELHPYEPIYNIGAKIRIKGIIDISILKKAYVSLINQHDAYRTTFTKEQEDIKVKITEEHSSELGFVDFSNCKDPIKEASLYMQNEFIKPFDLFGEQFLYVFTLVKVKQDYHYLFSVYHHIITDGWGTSLMFQRLVQNYNEIFEFGEIQEHQSFKYQDFIEDDSEYQNSDAFTNDKLYWKNKFNVLPENLFSKLNDNDLTNRSSRKELIIKRDFYNQLNVLAIENKVSTFHLLLAAFYAYFGRKHHNNDFAIGLPVLNRSKSKYKKTVGLFMGVSPLRIKLDFESGFTNLMEELKNQLRNDYRHQRFPLGKLFQELNNFKEKERVFNIMLSYEKQNYSNNFLDTTTQVIPLTHQSERVPLAIYIREFDESDDVKIDFDYNLNYFDEQGISQVTNHFQNLLEDVVLHPYKKINELSYLSKEERSNILVDFNKTGFDYPTDKTVINLFEEQVKCFPGKEALKDDYQSYSYSELDKLSSQFTEQIIGIYGKHDQSPIAVLLERSANMVVVLLGILKSGRSYIPLDPAFPKDRLSYIVNNSKSKVLIREKGYELEGLDDVSILSLEDIWEGISNFKGILSKTISPQDTAYIIYTSGSTGNPKGVKIGHQSLLNFLISMQNKPGITSKDILFSVTTYSFDISILEFFGPLISGATLYIADQSVLLDPNLIIEKINEIKPTIIQATPSFYQMLFNAQWKGDKELKALCGGDLLNKTLAKKLISSTGEIWNMYGPTETTIWSSVKKIESPENASNIGKPINNTQFYILDKYLSPMPVGVAGAIYIAGDGLAKGYYKNALLTNEKFIANPFVSNTLMYDTGDVGKWSRSGEIEFLGRNDNQVKIRGYRIELGDIESHLNKQLAIKDAVVIVKRTIEQESFLVAYIVKNDKNIDVEIIMDDLKKNLPYYMIPNAIIELEAIPLTPNQKVDRKNLSQLNIHDYITENNFKAPVSQLEKTLSTYWQQILNSTEPVSINDNFFALGGHSLNATRLITLITTGIAQFDITIRTIFEYPTIASLATYLNTLTPKQNIVLPVAEFKDFYKLTDSQYNIWLASQQQSGSIAYNMFATYKANGSINLAKVENAINKIIQNYEVLRTNFTEINGIPYQKINAFDTSIFKVEVEETKGEKTAIKVEQFNHTLFNLETDLLIRVRIISVNSNEYMLLFCTHHIVMDGLSLEILINEFVKNYNFDDEVFLLENQGSKIQFKDYSEWYNKTQEDNNSKNELFWKEYLQAYTSKKSFERDFDAKTNTQNGNHYSIELTSTLTAALKQLAVETQVTFYTVLAASLNVLIYKYSNYDDICIATVNSGRTITELNNQIGMFVKTLILRTTINPTQTFSDLLKNTQNDIFQIDRHQDILFDKLPKSPFDVMLVYQDIEFSREDIVLNDLKLTSNPVRNNYVKMPVLFNLFETNGILRGTIEYNCDLFDAGTIEIIALKYEKLLSEIVKKPLQELNEIDTRLEFETNVSFDFDFNF